ncbi:MAG: carboxylesterase family protein [Methanospirillum sp.]|uniref:carboxylesterase/lipase family protein n=1 Tax=Methanospirillum sp. TaxID=45200 RepID=UPI002372FBEE|nr:carboxylesterase family protein [Methanospirillum sp.]MDD1727509.1 carboxylesterase family protein [Methanospirillum sp.]
MKKWRVISSVLVICLLIIGFSAGSTQNGSEHGVVKTDAGSISGIQENGLRVYLGIPFAAPPTGDLRWKPPAPVKPWNGVKETKAYCLACPQPIAADPSLNMSEDCLYLNVWTPAKSADEKLPVMVFLYGGAFGKIAGSMPLYNGTALAEKGVVVVIPNYRVGALGFLAHPDLDRESAYNSSGNYGLLDQIAALQWVQRNIEAFGGDPSKVTIFGQSAGGESILIHLASPMSKRLFEQAIVESATLWANGAEIDAIYSKADAEQLGETFAKSLGYSGPDAITQMRRLNYQNITNATPWPNSSFQIVNSKHFEPTIDGWLIPDAPDNVFRLHNETPLPLMIGQNADDGTTLAADANMTVPEYITYIRNRFGKDADSVLANYPANSTQEVQYRLEQIMTRYDFADAAKFVAGSMSDLDRNTYLYRYSYVLPGQPYGAFHGSETILLFKVPIPPNPENTLVSDNLIDLWIRFAKTGDPIGGMDVTWPQYTQTDDRYLDINNIPTVKSGY